MNRLLLTVATLIAAVFAYFPASAQSSCVRNVDIHVVLSGDGGADICEKWDLSIYKGTEWYLVRENLGDIEISSLSVSDENGRQFIYEGEWDVKRSILEKDGRCGIVHKRGGCEICWGLGNWGDHLFTVRYHMSNVVRAYDDYDALHVQFVSSGIDPLPESAVVTISPENVSLNDTISRVWSFGFEGECGFVDGNIVARTTAPFSSDAYSMIVLARFDKGLFSPDIREEGSFEQVREKAFEGSAYQEFMESSEKNRVMGVIMAVVGSLLAALAACAAIVSTRKRNLKLFGVRRIKEIGWQRTVPFGGNLDETAYVLGRVNRLGSEANLCSAIILQMIKNGIITVVREKRSVQLVFKKDADLSSLSGWQKEFYLMLLESAGEDGILQHKEFSRWSRIHASRVSEWLSARQGAGVKALHEDGYVDGSAFTPDARFNARAAIGFKKFLKDFTLLGERTTEEVTLWQDYIIFAALYGIAEKVAGDLKEINPQAFEQNVGFDYPTMNRVLYFSNRMGNSTINAVQIHQSASSVGGKGGFSSFGGGGGFHGGGHGGGAR